MRVTSLIFFALPAVWTVEARPQDSSSEAENSGIEIFESRPVRREFEVLREPYRDPRQFVPNLGVVSVADMVKQLQDRTAEDADSTESENAEVLDNPEEAAGEEPISSVDDANEVID